jgi:hypothetical protein
MMRMLLFGILCVLMALPAFVYGQTTGNPPGTTGNPPLPNVGSPNVLTNPLRANSLTELFMQIIDILLVFAVPIIVFFIILAGFKYVTAGGNSEKIQGATRALTWAVVGGVLILGAKVLLTVIQNTVNALR